MFDEHMALRAQVIDSLAEPARRRRAAPISISIARAPGEDVRYAFRMRLAFSVACGVLAALVRAHPVQAADGGHVSMAWSSEDRRCVDQVMLAATVERTLGRAVFGSDGPPEATVVGHARRLTSGQYSAHIALIGPNGSTLSERSITTKGDCRRLDESAAVVIALMIDSLGDRPSELVVPERPVRAEPAPSNEQAPPRAVSRPKLRIALGLGGGASAGFLPSVTPLALFRGEVEVPGLPPFALAMRAHATSAGLIAGAGGTFDAWSAESSLCPTWTRPSFRLGLCLGAGAGAINGAPSGLRSGHSRARPVVFVQALPSVAIHALGPFWLRAEAGTWIPILREPWGISEPGGYVQVYQPGIVASIAALSAEIRADP